MTKNSTRARKIFGQPYGVDDEEKTRTGGGFLYWVIMLSAVGAIGYCAYTAYIYHLGL